MTDITHQTRGLLLILVVALLLPVTRVTAVAGEEQRGEKGHGVLECNERVAPVTSLPIDPAHFQQLIQKGEDYQQSGNLKQALTYFQAAEQSAKAGENHRHQTIAYSALGNGYLLTDNREMAEGYLNKAIGEAQKRAYLDLEIIISNRLARLYRSEGKKTEAIERYREALSLALILGNTFLSSTIRVNLADLETAEEAHQLLETALTESDTLADHIQKTKVLLAIAHRAASMNIIELAYQALLSAERAVLDSGNIRQLSQTLGMKAQLYEQAERSDEALLLTRQAIHQAQKCHGVDLLMKWEWQQARLLDETGNSAEALGAYRRAVSHLQAIRMDIPVKYTDGRSSFRETLEPLLLGLADFLLRQAEHEKNAEQSMQLLVEAQQTVELIKSAELQDYFLDNCAAPQRPLMDIEHLAPGTAVVYPIVFDQRLELLFGMGHNLTRATVPVNRQLLESTVRKIVESLRPAANNRLREYRKKLSGELYRWLITPLEEYLKNNDIHTIVYVPDGVLRTMPISALWNEDEQQYLIEQYAVATAPGLTLMDPEITDRTRIKSLLAGLPVPGPAVDELPEQMKRSLMISSSGTDGVPQENNQPRFRGMGIAQSKADALSEPRQIEIKTEQLQKALTLPGVTAELNAIAQLLPSVQLLGEDFLIEKFKDELRGSYRIIHIASHGFFSSSTEDSFIITYDHLLNMDELEEMFKSEAFSDAPVELLTLSACQTAEGDDRAPLGLSGIALKSGARAALGSLWPISDDATQQLLPIFYQHLTDSSMTKAQALQQAQLNLMSTEEFVHPYFWSSFILIGNWL